MLEQTLDGRPIIIRQIGNNDYMIYYDNEIYFVNERPITDQDRAGVRSKINEEIGGMLGNVLVQLLQPLVSDTTTF